MSKRISATFIPKVAGKAIAKKGFSSQFIATSALPMKSVYKQAVKVYCSREVPLGDRNVK